MGDSWAVVHVDRERPVGRRLTIAMFDHAGNPGYPTYWHARGYGLFAANPLGRSIFDPKQAAFKLSVAKGKSVEFRYRVVVYSRVVGVDEVNREADGWDGTR